MRTLILIQKLHRLDELMHTYLGMREGSCGSADISELIVETLALCEDDRTFEALQCAVGLFEDILGGRQAVGALDDIQAEIFAEIDRLQEKA